MSNNEIVNGNERTPESPLDSNKTLKIAAS
jgi:hypothetical protein